MMCMNNEVTWGHDPKDFLKKWTACLGEHDVENSLMLTLLDRIKDNPNLFGDSAPNFFSIGDSGVGLAMQTPPYNLVLGHGFDPDDFDLFIDFLQSKKIFIPGVIGEKNLVKNFSEAWAKKTGSKIEVVMNERIYSLSEVNKESEWISLFQSPSLRGD